MFGFSIRKRAFKIAIRVVITFAILLVVFVVVSLLIIDRGQPTVIGTLSAQELKTVRRSVRNSAVQIPIHWLSKGEVSASWHFTKELYTYRIMSVEVIDADTVLVFTRTNSYYPDGMRRPDFFARRIDGVWQAAPPGPIL